MKRCFLSLFCFSLVGCSTIYPERVACPRTSIIAEFSKTIDFQSDVPIRTEMDSLNPRCEQNGNQVLLNMRLRMTSLRLLQNFQRPMKIKPSYFVAVIDKMGNVVSRTNHNIEVTFEEKQTTKVSFENIQETVPMAEEFTVYVGFNLDEAQLDFLQKEREKKLRDQRPPSY